MPQSLNDRFKLFLNQLPFAEAIDDLEMPKGASHDKRADFFLENRKVIVELKSLECDPEYKIHAELKEHETREEYPVFFGPVEVHKILKHFPDGGQIMKRMFEKITRSIEDGFRSADKQICSTKRAFDCPNALGLLVFLNESLTVLSPEIVAKRLSQLLTRKDRNGAVHYTNIASASIIFENYSVVSEAHDMALPSITVDGPIAEGQKEFATIVDRLIHEWSAFNRRPLLRLNRARISDSDFVSIEELDRERSKSKPRYEVWEQQYRKAPYLRDLSDDAVLSHGARLASLMLPAFLKGGRKPPSEMTVQFMRGWTDFLEEARFRGLDLRRMREWRLDLE